MASIQEVQCVLWFHGTKSSINVQCNSWRSYRSKPNGIKAIKRWNEIFKENSSVKDFPRSGSPKGTTRGLWATDHVILNQGQVTWTTPELAPPLLNTTPHQREDVSALDRFNVHRCPTRRVFSGTGLVLVTRQAMIRYLYHSATALNPWNNLLYD
ncbi:uncharacterized protein TNCV_735581 [Trichonephila clavipes]|uniref:DUF4817 domain-containing protein n=1 Tax=Trichonephila clavipes TaxID=2585209 RepID=A0A8X6SMP1_TRICX|nr:uncharacterized protein TNCV_735581 [Trichonephila clavipes]